jgi:Tol biopolymer transport system component
MLLGHYRIEAPLGAGGMGEVYRARDLRLGRDVALKVLPKAFSLDTERVARFEREARVLASLNHPNLLVIHDVGEEGPVRFTVTELLEGRTLREVLDGGPLPQREAARTALQVLGGLGAAHARGVVHRDLKPENVFIGPEGHVKILDFGLATQPPPRAGASSEETTPLGAKTSPGGLLGTYRYMAPEQLRGEPVDPRTDLFALGLLLFEMLTGRHAFARPAPAEVVAAILKEPAQDPRALEPALSASLSSLVLHCLQKRPEDRPASARALLEPLRECASAEAGTAPAWRGWRRIVPAAAVLLFVFLSAWAIWQVLDRRGSGPPSFTPRQVTSHTAVQSAPALSPDGRTVAYASEDGGGRHIWVCDVQGGPPLRLTAGGDYDDSPAWFPDGSALAYVSWKAGRPGVWKVPRLGGPPVLLLEEAIDPAPSPDGTRLAFSRAGEEGFHRIGVAPLKRPGEARLVSDVNGGVWDHRRPAWSPDGAWLCYEDHNDLWTVGLDGSPARPLTRDDPPDTFPAWSPDGRHVYFSSLREGTSAVWRVEVRSGFLERLTLGTGPEQSPSLSRDGRRLAYATSLDRSAFQISDLASGRRTPFRPGREAYEPDLAPDGSALLFTSNREGRFDVWRAPLKDGKAFGEPQRLTETEGSCAHPVYSPDGRWIAFHMLEGGERDVWTLPAAGGEPVRVSGKGASDILPEWSPDGSRLAFLSDASGTHQVWEVPVAEGRPAGPARPLTRFSEGLVNFDWSPGGDALACVAAGAGGSDVWLIPVSGGGVPRRLTRGSGARFVTWDDPRDRLLVTGFWGDSRSSIRSVSPGDGAWAPLKGSEPTDPSGEPQDCTISADGRLLVFFEISTGGDVWVLDAGDASF